MLNYPFAENSWGEEFQLCNSPEHLIDLNGIFTREDQCFSIGFDGGEYVYFIKLNCEEKVYIFDFEKSHEHLKVEANSWKEYLIQIEKIEEEIKQDELEDLERVKHKKWWQFWI